VPSWNGQETPVGQCTDTTPQQHADDTAGDTIAAAEPRWPRDPDRGDDSVWF